MEHPTHEQAQDEMSLMYQRARMEWDERIGDTVSQLKIWRIVAIIALTIAALAVMGVSYIGAQSKIQPYALALSDDRVIALKALTALPQDQMELVTRSLIAGFIEHVRSVYSDPFAQQKAVQEAFVHLRGNDASHQQLSQALAGPLNPLKRAETELVKVTIHSVLPLGNGNTYQVEWTETITDRKGNVTGSPRYRAAITTAHQTPATPEGFMQNPMGLWFPTYQVTEITR